MAGTVTQSWETGGQVRSVTFSIVADAAAATVPATALTKKIEGTLLELVTNPGATAPTANYDITITDADGTDVLAGKGANRHTSTSERAPIYADTALTHTHVNESDTLTLNIANNAVNSAIIVAKLYYSPGVLP